MKASHFCPRALALLLAALLFALSFAACGGRQGKTLLTMDTEGTAATFSVNHYQLLLSRLRGKFVSGGISNGAGSADQAAFWDMQGYLDGGDTLKTWDAYYREQVLENCKTYLVALWLFEKNGLSLSDETRAAIEQEMSDILAYHADGSKTKLNAVLQGYGVNYEMLKSFYETEAKAEAVLRFLYGDGASLLDATVKDPYLSANYYRFKRILFSFYREVDGESVAMTDAEKEDIRTKANAMLAALQDKTEAEFEAAATKENGADDYTDGYYLPRSGSVGNNSEQVAFFAAVSERLSEMEIGEITLIETADGIQLIRRYEPTPGAYDLEVNAVWFSSFTTNLMAELFEKLCKTYFDQITVDEAILAGAPKIKEVEPNYYF